MRAVRANLGVSRAAVTFGGVPFEFVTFIELKKNLNGSAAFTEPCEPMGDGMIGKMPEKVL